MTKPISLLIIDDFKVRDQRDGLIHGEVVKEAAKLGVKSRCEEQTFLPFEQCVQDVDIKRFNVFEKVEDDFGFGSAVGFSLQDLADKAKNGEEPIADMTNFSVGRHLPYLEEENIIKENLHEHTEFVMEFFDENTTAGQNLRNYITIAENTPGPDYLAGGNHSEAFNLY